jgi:hypothetical protein
MPGSIFCPKCGTANQADFKFCISCGFDLSAISKSGPGDTNAEKTPPVYIAPVQSQPVVISTPARAGSAMPRWVPIAILVVVLAGVGYFIWNNEQKKKNAGNDTGLMDKKKGNDGQDTAKITEPFKPADHIKAKDFEGIWRAYETNANDQEKLGDPKDDLFVEVHNGRIEIYPRSDKDNEKRSEGMTCDDVVGNTISCLNIDHGETASIKLELSSSKNELTVTISSGEGGRTRIIKARRRDEGLK